MIIISFDDNFTVLSHSLRSDQPTVVSTKPHATMPIGIVGSNSLALLDWDSRCLARKKENTWIYTCLCFSFRLRQNNLGFNNQVQSHRYRHTCSFRHCCVRHCCVRVLQKPWWKLTSREGNIWLLRPLPW